MLRVRAATRRGGGQVLDIARGLWRWYDGWLVRDMIGNWVYYNGYSSGKGFCVDMVVNGRTCQGCCVVVSMVGEDSSMKSWAQWVYLLKWFVTIPECLHSRFPLVFVGYLPCDLS